MAEAIALAASLIAFIQLADRVETLRACPRDIRVILVEVSSLKAVLESLDFLLRNDSSPEPRVLSQLAGERGPKEECRRSVAQLERLLPSDIRAVQGKRQKIKAAAAHLAWPLKENSAKKLIDDISRYKTSITFALTLDSTGDIKYIKRDLGQVKEALGASGQNSVCTWLESTNPSDNHNNSWKLREDETGLWVIQSTEWEEWLQGKERFLWIHGIPGAGKTVLASLLVEQAKAACSEQMTIAVQSKPVVCVYYYCYFARSQCEATPFLQWLVGQLCRQARLVPREIKQLFQLQHVPSISQLLNALESICEDFGTVFVIIDAVDESRSREDLLKVLRDLVTDHRFDKVRLLATSREYYDIELYFSDISSRISMNNVVVRDDIQKYVHSALVSNRNFKSWPPDLVAEVEEALARGAKGMFRWAVCQIDILQRLGTKQDVRVAITQLPRTLDDTYERIFQLLPHEDRRFVHLALTFICGGNDLKPAPISASVVLEAVLFRLKSVPNDASGAFSFYDRDTLRDRCGCLVSLSPFASGECISLAHYTVREFLYSDRISHGSASYFALSDSLTWSFCLRTVFEVVIERQCEPAPSDPHSLYVYSLVAICVMQHTKRETWERMKESREFEVLTGKFDAISHSNSYIQATARAL